VALFAPILIALAPKLGLPGLVLPQASRALSSGFFSPRKTAP